MAKQKPTPAQIKDAIAASQGWNIPNPQGAEIADNTNYGVTLGQPPSMIPDTQEQLVQAVRTRSAPDTMSIPMASEQTQVAPKGHPIWDAVRSRVFGSPAATPQEVSDRALSFKSDVDLENALRNQVAERSLAQEHTTPWWKNALLGATAGVKAGLEAPYGGNDLGAGVIGGLAGFERVNASEAAKKEQQASAKTDALANLVGFRKAKTEEALKGETDRAEAKAKILAQTDSVRHLQGSDKAGRDEIEINLGGDRVAVKPRPELNRFISLFMQQGKDLSGLRDFHRKIYDSAVMKGLRKTEATPAEQGAAILEANDAADTLNQMGYKTRKFAIPNEAQLSEPGFLPTFVDAMSGGSSAPTFRAPLVSDLEKEVGLREGALSGASKEELDALSRTPSNNKKAFAQVLMRKYAPPR